MNLLRHKERELFSVMLLPAIETLERDDSSATDRGIAIKIIQDAEFILRSIFYHVTEPEISHEAPPIAGGPEASDPLQEPTGATGDTGGEETSAPDPETSDVNTWQDSRKPHRWIK
jgi:hypothetical protein